MKSEIDLPVLADMFFTASIQIGKGYVLCKVYHNVLRFYIQRKYRWDDFTGGTNTKHIEANEALQR
ncbi:MAG TPA: hypothetical protein PLB36_01365 [Bacillota bacterium]|nr:hypothetical protein [Bacillota bacterium]HOK63797.1 hypothetical protein [Bacillota bacterium]HOL11515.1 hypothetical protein [Bacillota bacterium]HOQ02572.1 hypothetical protein [Bacillota bacterium]HPP60344.1 hypothetical protein [Bacillota bacterium]